MPIAWRAAGARDTHTLGPGGVQPVRIRGWIPLRKVGRIPSGPGATLPRTGELLRDDFTRLEQLFAGYGVQAKAQDFTPQSLQSHFANGGGPVVFSGPGWGRATGQPAVPAHIYTATGANAQGVQILDSARANLGQLSWNQWQTATGAPARGAGIAAIAPSRPGVQTAGLGQAPPAGGAGPRMTDVLLGRAPAAPAAAGRSAAPGALARSGELLADSSRTGRLAEVEKWHDLVAATAAKRGVPESVIKTIIDIELQGNPRAGNRASGATGLMQVMPREAGPSFRDRPSREELLNPETNVDYGTGMLANLYDQLKSWDKVVAAYLGAYDYRTGQITNARDAVGTSGFDYAWMFNERRPSYQQRSR
jgi:soluble lytic murein transglycosylase-like protein